MASSKISSPKRSIYYGNDEVKTWFDSTKIAFVDGAIASIRITNDIAFVRLEGIKIKTIMSSMTKIIDGLLPMPSQAVFTEKMVNSTKTVIYRVYPNQSDLYLTAVGYAANDEIPGVTFCYPLA